MRTKYKPINMTERGSCFYQWPHLFKKIYERCPVTIAASPIDKDMFTPIYTRITNISGFIKRESI